MLKMLSITQFLKLSMLVCCCGVASAQTGNSDIVISQIYGGGGNSGATYRNDFIELFNRSSVPVNITGWSVQYAAATGSSWDRTILTGTIQPGQYYLIEEQQGNGGSVLLPTPDVTGGIGLSAASGKVALVKNSSNLIGASPSGAALADFVGYGSANSSEGRPALGLSNTTALFRKANGCTDSNSNLDDFSESSPLPRNGRSGLNLCSPVTAPPVRPVISQTGVTNAATFAPGPVAPGEIITIFGSALGAVPLKTLELTSDGLFVTKSLAGTRVLFDGVAAPLIYVSATQLSAIVPAGLSGRVTTEMRVEYGGVLSDPLVLVVAAASPGIFTANSSGRGQVAALNQDNSFNTPATPALRGSIVTVYATGAGQMIPAAEDGRVTSGPVLPRPVANVTAQIGGQNAEILYAGAAPGLATGVLQVNIRIPDQVAMGSAVPLTLRIGEATSQGAVTIAVGGSPSL